MVERDITSKTGILNKNLPKYTYWQRMPDLPIKNQHKKPFDGLLWFKNTCWPIEVKMKNSKLTEGEISCAEEYYNNGIMYVILRCFEDKNMWVIEKYKGESMASINLTACLEWLIS
jgi:hypothetical protein